MIDYTNIMRFDIWREKWKNKDAMNLQQYISFNVHPEDVLIIGSLMIPNFVEVENCIFLVDNFDEKLFKQLKINHNNEYVEKNINQIHVYDLFDNCRDKVDDNTFERLGKLLKISWSSYLLYLFPKRNIIVDLIINESEYGPIITVYQKYE